ncbi:uncharacterized protein LOC112092269 [Morus notabilis]|uniref:uncharacterized protein LOC112092269 n=1 Tax=Morus notabilis TaxID=981085 RepID=UPI000CECEC32|nr:uncharacterized protein LOC112092269 [Morus notabilis]
MKFPTPSGIGKARGNQYDSRLTYSETIRHYTESTQVRRELRMVEARAEHCDLDPRFLGDEAETGPVEELVEVPIDEREPMRTLRVGSELGTQAREKLVEFLRTSLDVFAWTHEDMEGRSPDIMCHRLNIDEKYPPKRQKRRPMNAERYEALRDEVDKLIRNDFIREVLYPRWVSNPVLVKKLNGDWRTCDDFNDLNKVCPKDSFPLPRIDQLVEATAGHDLLSFMDTYSGYNQIPMLDRDQEHTAFVTDRGLYCYKVMPFGLKNAGATYQRLVNKMSAGQIGKSMNVYVDDILLKSKKIEDHVEDLRRMFGVLRAYKMKLNPRKCAFGVASGKFLGFMVNSRGIEANPEKIHALLDMESPRKPNEVQKLTGCVAALNRFISKSTDKCVSFFDTLRGSKPFVWTEECEQAFQQLKEHLGKPHLLSKPATGEVLSLYLAVSEHTVSSVLIREEKKVQMSVYYTSKRLLDAETRYPQMEKLALVMIVTARKLRHYFQAHSIQVLTNHPLRQVLQKPDTSGRLLKWSIELSQFDINYKPWNAIKGQALADFVAEFTGLLDDAEEVNETLRWKLYVDGSSNDNGSGAELVLHTPEGHKITSAIRFDFPASNNKVEYEALLAGLQLAEHLKAGNLDIFSDSQLIVNQVKGQYQTRDEKMAAYLKKVKEALGRLSAYDIQQVPRAENSNADALAKLATSRDAELLNLVPVEVLKAPTTERRPEVTPVDYQLGWMDPITRYLAHGELPEDRKEAKRVRYQAARYTMHDNILYRKGYSTALLRCLGAEEAKKVLYKVHDGICGNHAGRQSLAYKILWQGYYWPSLKKDAAEYAKKCESCQRFGVPHSLVSVNGKQFNNDNTCQFCELLEIHKNFSSVVYPQSNGQVEAVNKIIKVTLK